MAISQPTKVVTKAVAIALGLCLIAIVAFWASQLLAPRVGVAPVVVSAPPSDNQESAFTKQLFGNAPTVSATNAIAADSRLQVLGVMTGSSGVAVLSVDGAPAKPYSVGQTIAKGVVLSQVKADKVIIKRDGVEQTLPAPALPNIAILTVGKSSANASNNPVTSNSLPSSAYPPLAGATPSNQPAGTNGPIQNNQSSPPQGQTNPAPNPPFVNSQVPQNQSIGDPSAQNSSQNNNNSQSAPVGSSMRSGGPQ
jgi:general secretion pathway protein C